MREGARGGGRARDPTRPDPEPLARPAAERLPLASATAATLPARTEAATPACMPDRPSVLPPTGRPACLPARPPAAPRPAHLMKKTRPPRLIPKLQLAGSERSRSAHRSAAMSEHSPSGARGHEAERESASPPAGGGGGGGAATAAPGRRANRSRRPAPPRPAPRAQQPANQPAPPVCLSFLPPWPPRERGLPLEVEISRAPPVGGGRCVSLVAGRHYHSRPQKSQNRLAPPTHFGRGSFFFFPFERARAFGLLSALCKLRRMINIFKAGRFFLLFLAGRRQSPPPASLSAH